jgi:hypothetical protein
MTWLVWRQHRAQAAFGAAALALFATFLVVTGLRMNGDFHTSGLAGCLASSSDCSALQSAFEAQFKGLRTLADQFTLLPLLVGLFWGAPLVARELERGTNELVWTQSVSRRRWITVKVAAVLAGTAVVAVAATILVNWWIGPLDASTGDRFTPNTFDIQGIVPIAYCLFAVALGIAAGAVTRRTLPAMAATLAGFLVLRLGVLALARPHYLPALQAASTHTNEPGGPGSMVLNTSVVDRAGQRFSSIGAMCPVESTQETCLTSHHPTFQVMYQPASRFWTFQMIEAAIFVAVAIALACLAVWWVRRRLA